MHLIYWFKVAANDDGVPQIRVYWFPSRAMAEDMRHGMIQDFPGLLIGKLQFEEFDDNTSIGPIHPTKGA